MFGIDMACDAGESCSETSASLSKQYKKLAALFTVQSSGALDGSFHIVVDKEGLFTLAGTIVMLPEKRIQESRKKGTQQDADDLCDAVSETGNLLVGSWDRIFREGWSEHGHFLQTGTFIGVPWNDSQQTLGVDSDEEFTYIPIEMTVGEFPAFQCGVIFPESLFADKPAEAEAPAEAEEPVAEADEAPAEETTAAEPQASEAETAEPVDEAPEQAQEPAVEEVEQVAAEEPVETAEAQTDEPAADAEEAVEAPPAEPAGKAAAEAETRGAVTQSIAQMVNSSPVLPGEGVGEFLKSPASAVMQTGVVWAGPEDSVQQAMTAMQESDAGYLMVGENGKLEGVVSWVDLIGAISIYLKPVFAKWRRPADDATLQIRLKVIMTRPVRTAKPDTSLAVIMDNMCQYSLRCLPIVDAQGSVQGLVTAFDIFKALQNTDADITTLGQVSQGTPVE
jgi:CBS domain-containing protein